MRSGSFRWLSQNVTIAPNANAPDGHGVSTYGTGVVTPARIVVNQKKLLDDNGDNLVSSCQVYVDGTSAVASNSKITLPDGTSPKILSVKPVYDAQGALYAKAVYT